MQEIYYLIKKTYQKQKAKSFAYSKYAVARNKGDKDYSKSEKQLFVSLINDYSLFGATDNEVIQVLSHKIGKKISETLPSIKERSKEEENRF